MSIFHSPSLDQLKRAIEISEEIQRLESELQAVLAGEALLHATRGTPQSAAKQADAPAEAAIPKEQGKRFVSAEARAKMAAAQRARWANAGNSASSTSAAKRAPKASGKRTLSPEAREKIAAAQRRRWAQHRKG